MNLGFSTLGCPAWPLEHAIAQAEEIGFEGIELRVLDGEIITPKQIRMQTARITRAFRCSNVKLAVLDSSVALSSSSVAERRKQEEDLLAWIDVAQSLGVERIRVFGGRRPEGVTLPQAVRNVAESCNRVAPVAESAGVLIAIETHDDFSRAAVTSQALALVDSPSVGAVWDTLHTTRHGEAPTKVLELMADRILHVHVKDAKIRSTDDVTHVLEGRGDVPNREAISLLRQHGYDDWLMLEWEKQWHPDIEEPEVAFPYCYRALREYMSS